MEVVDDPTSLPVTAATPLESVVLADEAMGIWLMAMAPPATLTTPATVTTARERHVRRHRFFMADVMPGRGGRGVMSPGWRAQVREQRHLGKSSVRSLVRGPFSYPSLPTQRQKWRQNGLGLRPLGG